MAIPPTLCARTTIDGTRVIQGTLDASGAFRALPDRTGTGLLAGQFEAGQWFSQALRDTPEKTDSCLDYAMMRCHQGDRPECDHGRRLGREIIIYVTKAL